MSDIPASDKPRQKDQARIISRPGAVQKTPAWPEEEPDPQFAPGSTRPVEMSEKDNDKDTPIGMTEETVAALAADLDTPKVDVTAVPENSAQLPPFDAEIHQEEPQAGAPAAQDDDQEGSTTVMLNVNPAADLDTIPVDDAAVSEDSTPLTANDAQGHQEEPQAGAAVPQDADQEDTPTMPAINPEDGVDAVAEKPISEAELIPAGFSDGDVAEDQPGTDTDPAMVGGQGTDADQPESGSDKSPAPANAQMISEIVLSVLRGMTADNATEESKAKAHAEFNILRKAIKKTVEGKKTLTEKKSYVEGMYTTMLPIDTKAKKLTAVSSIMRGDAGLELKKGIPHGQFRSAIMDKFPAQRYRKLQEDMSLAGTNSVERHCDLGVTTLVKFAAIIKKDEYLRNLPDPVQTILAQVKNDTGFIGENYTTLADIAIADFKLRKAQLVIDPATLRDFIAAGHTLDGKDIKEMLAMKKVKEEALARGEDAPDPADFLQAITDSAGTRVFALTGAHTTEEQMATSPDMPPAIPEINSTLVKTTETLTQALSLPEFPKKDVDRSAVRNLMEVLKRIDDATNQS